MGVDETGEHDAAAGVDHLGVGDIVKLAQDAISSSSISRSPRNGSEPGAIVTSEPPPEQSPFAHRHIVAVAVSSPTRLPRLWLRSQWCGAHHFPPIRTFRANPCLGGRVTSASEENSNSMPNSR